MINLIMSGLRSCNGKCPYCACYRLVHGNNDGEFQYDWSKVRKELENRDLSEVMIWGADAVVSWNSFKKTVDFVESLGKSTQIYASTNGSTLTDNVIDYLNEHSIKVQLSHDGVAEHYKLDFDPLDRYDITKLNSVVINCVIHNNNCDIMKNVEYFSKKVPTIKVAFSLPQISKENDFTIHKENADKLIGQCTALLLSDNPMYRLNVPTGDDYKIDYREEMPTDGCLMSEGISNHIDTLGNWCQCNLVDSLNPKLEFRRNEICNKCKYRYSTLCGVCGLLEPPDSCYFMYKLNELLSHYTVF